MKSADAERLEALDRQSFLHPFTQAAAHLEAGPLIMTEGRGLRVRDSRGREYLDAMAGLWCVNVGYGREEIASAAADQMRRLSFFHAFASMSNEPAIELAAKLVALAGPPMSKVFFGTSGSDANETQIKLVWHYNNLLGRPRKKKIIARRRGYHGVNLGAGSMTGLPAVHAGFDLPLERFLHVSPAHWPAGAEPGVTSADYARSLADELDRKIRDEGPESVAAFIAEPVMGAGGVLLPPEEFFAAVQPVLREHDVLLIADEVICGFGRLGRWLGCERYAIEPDLITLAKGLTSGYVPMSACVISERVWEVLRDSGEDGPLAHGYTYTGHPVAAAAALANLEILERERLIERAEKQGAVLQENLRRAFAEDPLVADVRGTGLIAALQTQDPDDAQRLGAFARDEGLLLRSVSGAVALSPALVMSEAEGEEIVERLGRALEKLRAAS